MCFLSPSGCTFWGKKPWSRKKKILWQLGTLIGAPVGITLIAGIAVPAMVIGIPVYIGRKVRIPVTLIRNYQEEDFVKTAGNFPSSTRLASLIVLVQRLPCVQAGFGVGIQHCLSALELHVTKCFDLFEVTVF